MLRNTECNTQRDHYQRYRPSNKYGARKLPVISALRKSVNTECSDDGKGKHDA